MPTSFFYFVHRSQPRYQPSSNVAGRAGAVLVREVSAALRFRYVWIKRSHLPRREISPRAGRSALVHPADRSASSQLSANPKGVFANSETAQGRRSDFDIRRAASAYAPPILDV